MSRDPTTRQKAPVQASGLTLSLQFIRLGFLIADLCMLLSALILAYTIRIWLGERISSLGPLLRGLGYYATFWPVILIWPVIFLREGLYPGLWFGGSKKLRKLWEGTTLASLILMTMTFLTKTGPEFSRFIISSWWLISLALLPLGRAVFGNLLHRLGSHGPAAIIIGAGKSADLIVKGFGRRLVAALHPVALFDDDETKHGRLIRGVPVVGPIDQAEGWAAENGIRAVIIAMPGVSREALVPLIDQFGSSFPWVIVVPDLFGLSTTETDAREIDTIQVLEIRRNLLLRRNRWLKRSFDILSSCLLGVLSLPFVLLISVAILIEDGMPILYAHRRIGYKGERFLAWKFRTMITGADQVLEDVLKRTPELEQEWDKRQKLRDDPRLTKVGRVLRRFSLDEIPQLLNILVGEMSMVGPRPIMDDEISRYHDAFFLYKQVRPGLTGIWQVSGRSDLGYHERVRLDTYYVRNWSIWLDMVVLVRTIWVVLAGIGAY